MLFKKGDYGQIKTLVLRPEQRLENIPEDTKQVPCSQWVKGRLCFTTEMYETVNVTTATGRIVYGELREVNPNYKIYYGDFVDELMRSRETIMSEMWGSDDETRY